MVKFACHSISPKIEELGVPLVKEKVESLYESFIEIDGFGLELETKTVVTTKLFNDIARILCLEYHGQLERLKRMIKSTKLE